MENSLCKLTGAKLAGGGEESLNRNLLSSQIPKTAWTVIHHQPMLPCQMKRTRDEWKKAWIVNSARLRSTIISIKLDTTHSAASFEFGHSARLNPGKRGWWWWRATRKQRSTLSTLSASVSLPLLILMLLLTLTDFLIPFSRTLSDKTNSFLSNLLWCWLQSLLSF